MPLDRPQALPSIWTMDSSYVEKVIYIVGTSVTRKKIWVPGNEKEDRQLRKAIKNGIFEWHNKGFYGYEISLTEKGQEKFKELYLIYGL